MLMILNDINWAQLQTVRHKAACIAPSVHVSVVCVCTHVDIIVSFGQVWPTTLYNLSLHQAWPMTLYYLSLHQAWPRTLYYLSLNQMLTKCCFRIKYYLKIIWLNFLKMWYDTMVVFFWKPKKCGYEDIYCGHFSNV